MQLSSLTLVLLSLFTSIPGHPTKPLDERSTVQALLILEGNKSGEELPQKKVVAKSVFVVPSFECPPGMKLDNFNKCVEIHDLNEEGQLDFLFAKILSLGRVDSGPAQISIPISNEDRKPEIMELPLPTTEAITTTDITITTHPEALINTPTINTPIINTKTINTPIINTKTTNTPIINSPTTNTRIFNTPISTKTISTPTIINTATTTNTPTTITTPTINMDTTTEWYTTEKPTEYTTTMIPTTTTDSTTTGTVQYTDETTSYTTPSDYGDEDDDDDDDVNYFRPENINTDLFRFVNDNKDNIRFASDFDQYRRPERDHVYYNHRNRDKNLWDGEFNPPWRETPDNTVRLVPKRNHENLWLLNEQLSYLLRKNR